MVFCPKEMINFCNNFLNGDESVAKLALKLLN